MHQENNIPTAEPSDGGEKQILSVHQNSTSTELEIKSSSGENNRPGDGTPQWTAEDILREMQNRTEEMEGKARQGNSSLSGDQTLRITDWYANKVFVGEPPQREYIVDGIFPKGQASLFGAAGGVGKSFSALDLSCVVAREPRGRLPQYRFGGPVACHGTAVYISAEDDQIEIHNRIKALGGPPPFNNLFVSILFPF